VKKLIGVLTLALTCTALASANPPVVVSPAVVPVYSAIAGQPQSNEEVVALLKELIAAVKENTEAVKAGAGNRGGNPPPIPPADSALSIAAKSCIACHSPKSSEPAGAGFRLFADDSGTAFAPLNPRDRQRVASRVLNGSMPPPKLSTKIADDERKALADFFKK
jgi:mono/diheme cytochrome c family protein